MIEPAEYAARRARVMDAIGAGGVMILPAGAPSAYSRDVELRFRAHADFLYLCGLDEPHGLLVLRPGAPQPFTLFVRPRDPAQETWTGRRPGPDGAAAATGADAAFTIDDLRAQLPALLDGAERLFYEPWADAALDRRVHRTLGELHAKEALGKRAPRTIVHPGVVLHGMRVVKSAAEVEALAAACRLTAAGHRAGIARVRPGAMEYQVQAAIERTFVDGGGAGPGFATIVGAGANGCILHYVENAATIGARDLVLLDAGAERARYNGDVTRTVPASGRFEPAQRALYDAVLGALEALIAEVRPGQTMAGVRERHAALLAGALVDLGVLEGPADAMVAAGRHKPYTLHGPSHWLGLDVHDVGGSFAAAGVPRPFEPGMVLTVEPGLYFPPDDEKVPLELRGQAVRIEDDVVVTGDGCRVLTRDVPVAADEIEALVGAGETR